MKEKIQPYLVPLANLAAGGLIAASVIFKGGNFSLPSLPGIKTPSPSPQIQGFEDVTQLVPVDKDPVLGDPKAKVTMIEFSDFQCSYCQRFALETFPQLKTEYVDTGKMKVVFKNFPLTTIHSFAEGAALAVECAFEQNKFWEYKEKLFQNQTNLQTDKLKEYARELGLDGAQFDQCLDTKKYDSLVKEDLADGQKAGILGTPGFIINGTIIPGAYPLSEFERVINEKLK